jgi:hypothetical protein
MAAALNSTRNNDVGVGGGGDKFEILELKLLLTVFRPKQEWRIDM